jgi:accessory gene regulator protein AgrB
MGWKTLKNKMNEFTAKWSVCLICAFISLLMIGIFESYFGFSVSIMFYVLLSQMTIIWSLGLQPEKAVAG